MKKNNMVVRNFKLSPLLIFALYCSFICNIVIASEPGVKLQKAQINLNDDASLQRGAKHFMNFCAGCHSAGYMRYSRMAKDLNMTDLDGEVLTDIVKSNLMFNATEISSHIKSGLTPKDANTMFGVPPPDLTMVTRVRGNDWVYSYLKSFYTDPKRPWGMNNAIFKDVAMPNVLYNYQGRQELVDGKLELVEPGLYNNEQFDQMATDITAFLSYSAEPYRKDRMYYGIWVLLFLSIFLVFAYLLKAEYWRDIKK